MRAVVVAGGETDPGDRRHLDDADLVIAADGGAAWLTEIGCRPHVLVGDLDSIEPALVDRLVTAGVRVERHRPDKDATDAELALEAAVAAGAERIVMLGALAGRRLDHALANLLLLADAGWARKVADLRIVRGGTRVRVLRTGELRLEGAVGSLVTLLPVGGDARGVRTAGLRYALVGETLRFGRSRGLSNVVTATPASVSLEGGVLLVIEIATEGVD